MNNALLKDNLAARAVDSQTRKVFSRSGLIAGLCLSSLVSSYAIPGGVDATKAKNESVMITQQAKRVSGVVTDSAGEPIPGANVCLLYTSPSPRDRTRSRMPSSA